MEAGNGSQKWWSWWPCKEVSSISFNVFYSLSSSKVSYSKWQLFTWRDVRSQCPPHLPGTRKTPAGKLPSKADFLCLLYGSVDGNFIGFQGKICWLLYLILILISQELPMSAARLLEGKAHVAVKVDVLSSRTPVCFNFWRRTGRCLASNWRASTCRSTSCPLLNRGSNEGRISAKAPNFCVFWVSMAEFGRNSAPF